MQQKHPPHPRSPFSPVSTFSFSEPKKTDSQEIGTLGNSGPGESLLHFERRLNGTPKKIPGQVVETLDRSPNNTPSKGRQQTNTAPTKPLVLHSSSSTSPRAYIRASRSSSWLESPTGVVEKKAAESEFSPKKKAISPPTPTPPPPSSPTSPSPTSPSPTSPSPTSPSPTSPSPTPPPPLWQRVKQTMDNEAYLRKKCTVYKLNISLAKTANEKLKRQVSTSRSALAERDARVASLEAQLAKQTAQEQECQALRAENETRAYQVRVYKTALKAAFKLPGMEGQATYRSMLEITEKQLRKSLGEKPAGGREVKTEVEVKKGAEVRREVEVKRGKEVKREVQVKREADSFSHPKRDEVPALQVKTNGESVFSGNEDKAVLRNTDKTVLHKALLQKDDKALPRNTDKFLLRNDEKTLLQTDDKTVLPSTNTPLPQTIAPTAKTPHTPTTKKRAPDSNSNSNSDSDAPSTQKRKSTPRSSARKIVHDDSESQVMSGGI
ncbi:hypothetical protein E4U55_005833 [Claviceps digitariae]|nr:hypothetical protein E4U55_005833 [Claviceps digitariae]